MTHQSNQWLRSCSMVYYSLTWRHYSSMTTMMAINAQNKTRLKNMLKIQKILFFDESWRKFLFSQKIQFFENFLLVSGKNYLKSGHFFRKSNSSFQKVFFKSYSKIVKHDPEYLSKVYEKLSTKNHEICHEDHTVGHFTSTNILQYLLRKMDCSKVLLFSTSFLQIIDTYN